MFLSKMLKTGEMLNILNVFGEPPPQKSARNRGNVKYVKYFGTNWAKNAQTFNIFNISLVLSILDQKHSTFPLFRGHVVAKQGKC